MAEHLEYGVIVLDKPSGPTSHQVAAWARDAMGAERAGHAGTLDPKVTGILVIGLSSATRALDLVREAGKEYISELVLHRDVDKDRLARTIADFQGDVLQVPPKRSAVKRRLRTRRVHTIELLEHAGRHALFRTHVEAGTYIRSLCHDIGLILGTGAHMGDLRRTKLGPFKEGDMVTLHDLRDAIEWFREDGSEGELRRVVRPMEELLGGIPSITVRDSAVDALCHGAPLAVAGILDVDASATRGHHVAVLTGKGEAIGFGHALMSPEEMVKAPSGIAVELSRVFMMPDIYPRGWGGARDPVA
jgi:H/ACA ribonucleoprotein complex subunit 4